MKLLSFNSTIFIFAFLPIAIIGNLLIKKQYSNMWLMVCSAIFYMWAQPKFLILLVAVIIWDYIIGILIEKTRFKNLFLVIGISLNLTGLFYFKYINFVIRTINKLFKSEITLLNVILPVGISFFTFKSISYIADVYTKKICAEKNIIHMAIYISMFPQILSGPIDKYENLKETIIERNIDYEKFNNGIRRFIIGLSKKVVVANTLGQMVDMIWTQGAGANSVGTAWLGSIAYSLQIYFDFAGYSDMAIGIGKMMGFDFSENFNLPYMAKSISEFWKRWHITLGSWFREYVYIPLGGGWSKRVYFNLAIVFLLTGLWHGAEWHFILWGMLHGACRLAERIVRDKKVFIPIPDEVRKVLGHMYLLFVVNIGWVLFRAPNISGAIQYIKTMFGVLSTSPSGISVGYYLNRWNFFVFVIAVFFSTAIPAFAAERISNRCKEKAFIILRDFVLISLLFFSMIRLVTGTYKSFIYFQF